MTLSGLFVQLLNGLASASTLFLLAAGLSLIFGVTRIVNFAHGSLYMLGAYVAWSLTARMGGALGFWAAIGAAALAIGALGAVIEVVLLRRIYRAPELFQLLATFALTLIVRDAVLFVWGPDDLLGPRAPGLSGAIEIFDRRLPLYDLALIVIGPLVLAGLWMALTRTRWGALVRAATQDREMVGALGVNQSMLFTSVFTVGAALAGLAGALQLPREPANAALDLAAIGDAFVVVVVGGLGSVPGAFLAAILIAEVKALCIALGAWTPPWGGVIVFPKLTLVAEFLVMAIVLVVRPWGLLGAPQAPERPRALAPPMRPATAAQRLAAGALVIALAALPLATPPGSYTLVLAIDILIGVLFATSLHFMMGPGGMQSFGHAAFFGLGAYGATLLLKTAGAPMEIALPAAALIGALGAFAFGGFAVRLGGVYFAMLTLAFAQIIWSIVYQWDTVTGGSNGVVGVWPAPWAASKPAYYYLSLVCCVVVVLALRRMLFAPFGYALRATRDQPLRAEAIGVHVRHVQWRALVIAGGVCGLAGGLFAFSKGSISPDVISIGRSVDGLVMVLLGGVSTMAGPIVGAASFLFLQDMAARHVDYWRAMLGVLILVLVLAFPDGIVGAARKWIDARRAGV